MSSTPIWFVTYQPGEPRSRKHHPRSGRTFQNEPDAKAFAKARLSDARHIVAGTINPHLPKRVVGSAHIIDWLDENGT